METHARTAFTAALVLDRRQQAQDTSATSAVAIDSASQRLYVGLEDGVLEEYALVHGAAGVRASLAARRHAAKKAILGIHALPEHGLIVLLSADGQVQVLDAETLEGQPLPLRNAVATCVASPPGCLPRLAVAAKPSKRTVRFLVYELPPGSSGAAAAGRPHPPQLVAQAEVPDSATAVHGMGWVGGQLAVCCGTRYLLVAPFGPARGAGTDGSAQWRELFSVPPELAYWPAMLATMSDVAQALLVVGPAGIIIDAGGSPVGSALRLEGLGATPRALSASGAFFLLVSEAGIHVFDRQSGGEVQRLAFSQDLRPLPGQPLYASAAGDGAPPPVAARAASGLRAAGCVAVAGRRIVWLCLPVSPADQARELLGRGDFGSALELIEAGLAQGASWAQAAAAQAALLLLHECRFAEAVRCLEQCSPDTFQPSQLFPLFPTYTARWAQQAPTHQQFWRLHAPLPSLETLITRKLSRGHQQPESSSSRAHSRSPSHGARGSSSPSSGSLFALEREAGSSEGGASPAASSSKSNQASKSQHPGNQQEGARQPPASPEALAQQAQRERRRESEPGGAERRRLQRQAWEALAQYLFRVRMLDGVACLPGVDTLLLHLLADLGDARQVAAFAAVPNQVDVPSVEPRLQAEGWHHALATLYAARPGGAPLALHIWRQVADGQLAAPASPGVQAAERREALESAAVLLRDPAACPEATLVAYIPWLLAASQPAALEVLTARSLTPAAVLPLLPPESDVRWQYLAHLVEAAEQQQGWAAGAAGRTTAGQPGAAGPATPAAAAADPAIHTELATQLAAAILRAEPELRSAALRPGSGSLAAKDSCANPTRRPGSAGGGRRRSHRTSTAALVSGGSLEPWPGATPAQAMRLRLRSHLQRSNLYDAGTVLRSLQGTGLQEELVVLYSKMGDHMAALRTLALTLHDVAAAEAYARAHLAPPDYRALLHLVLEPGPGREPCWDDACYLITALGDHLDPQEVLQALPAGMPLASAAAVLAPMLADRLHRRRRGALVKNLHRARLAGATGALCDAQAQHVTVGADRACPHCHLRLGGKVFVVLQPGVTPGGANGRTLGGATEAAGGAAASTAAAASGDQAASGAGEAEEGPALQPPGEDPIAAAARRLKQAAAGGQEPQVLCYACYRRLSGPAGAALQPAAAAAAAGRPGGTAAGVAAAAAAVAAADLPDSSLL
ncbi:hypothetical protein ABPG77_006486 [Micractinium sp. CCAP 211/92]